MQTIDPALQRSVWARVRGAEAEPGDLAARMQSEAAGVEAYRRLSRLVRGRGAALLRRMAVEETRHLRTLQALRFLETGRCAALPAPPEACLLPLPEALHAAVLREERAAEAYDRAAARCPDHAEEYAAMAADERRHGELLKTIPEYAGPTP